MGGLFVYSIGGCFMKSKRHFVCIFAVILVLSGVLYTSACAASPEASVSPATTFEVTSPKPSETPETTKDNSSKQWIFFAVTSVLSLALAIPLAIRSGNKKYGK